MHDPRLICEGTLGAAHSIDPPAPSQTNMGRNERLCRSDTPFTPIAPMNALAAFLSTAFSMSLSGLPRAELKTELMK